MKEAVAFSMLFIPLIWELISDRKGDPNKNMDVVYRAIFILASSIYPWLLGHNYLASISLSFGIFFLLFDYLIHIIMLKRKDWFSYLGTTSIIDRIKFWKNMSPWNRFFTRLAVFMIGLTLYITI